MKRNSKKKNSDKQLISAKGMSLLFHYGSNLTYALVVQPLSRKNCCCCTIVQSERIFERTWSAFVLSHHSFITIYIDFYIWTLDEYYQFYTFSFLHEQNSKMWHSIRINYKMKTSIGRQNDIITHIDIYLHLLIAIMSKKLYKHVIKLTYNCYLLTI